MVNERERMLYHKNLGLPKELLYKLNHIKEVSLTYSRHAIIASQSDRYATRRIKLRDKLSFKADDVIELETDANGSLLKLVVRVSYNADLDIIYVLSRGGFVKTVWLNKKTDLHETLNESKYERAI